MGAGNPVEHLPGGSVPELDVEDRDLDLAVAQPPYGVIHTLRPKDCVVASPEGLLKGITNHRVIFGNKNAHNTVVRRGFRFEK
jgi:hypothetical protein